VSPPFSSRCSGRTFDRATTGIGVRIAVSAPARGDLRSAAPARLRGELVVPGAAASADGTGAHDAQVAGILGVDDRPVKTLARLRHATTPRAGSTSAPQWDGPEQHETPAKPRGVEGEADLSQASDRFIRRGGRAVHRGDERFGRVHPRGMSSTVRSRDGATRSMSDRNADPPGWRPARLDVATGQKPLPAPVMTHEDVGIAMARVSTAVRSSRSVLGANHCGGSGPVNVSVTKRSWSR